MRTLKRFVAVFSAAVILYAAVAVIYSLPYDSLPPILAGLGVVLLVISIISNTKRNSPIKLGTANRGEFYAVIILLISILLV